MPGTLPVLDGEGIQRESPNTEPRTRLDGTSDRIDTGLVPGGTRQVAPAGPPAIAIHNNRDMRWKPFRVQRLSQMPIPLPRPQRVEKCFHALTFNVTPRRERPGCIYSGPVTRKTEIQNMAISAPRA